MLQSLIKL